MMNWIDITILVLVFFSMIISLFRGFLREAISLFIWVVGVLLALRFSDDFGVYFSRWVSSSTIRYVLAFALIFIATLIVGIIINILIKLLLKKSGLNIMDRILGIFFGAARGILIAAIFIIFLDMNLAKDANVLKQSLLVPYFNPVVVWLNHFLPDKLKKVTDLVDEKQAESKPSSPADPSRSPVPSPERDLPKSEEESSSH